MISFNGQRFVEVAFEGPKHIIGSSPKTGPKGTYVAWLPSSRSATAVIGWARMMGLTDTVAPDDLHITIMYSPDAEVDPHEHGDVPLPRQVGLTRFQDPRTAVLGKLGSPGALVTTYNSSVLNDRHNYWRDERKLVHAHEGFIPHMTLSYAADKVSPEVYKNLQANPCPIPLELAKERIAWCN